MCGETAAHESGYLCRLSRPLLSCSSSRLAIGCSCGHETNMIGSSCSRDVTRTLLQLLLRATFREKKIGSEGLLLPLATLTIALSFPSSSSREPPLSLVSPEVRAIDSLVTESRWQSSPHHSSLATRSNPPSLALTQSSPPILLSSFLVDDPIPGCRTRFRSISLSN